MTTLKASRGMGNHLLCVRYTKSGANTENAAHRIKMQPFMIVHHMKNIVSVCISMMFLSYISESNGYITCRAFWLRLPLDHKQTWQIVPLTLRAKPGQVRVGLGTALHRHNETIWSTHSFGKFTQIKTMNYIPFGFQTVYHD